MTRLAYVHDPRIAQLEDIIDPLAPGELVPTIRELGKVLGLPHGRISLTLRAMVDDGLLRRAAGRRYARTDQAWDGEVYSRSSVEVAGASHVYKVGLFKGRAPYKLWLFTNGEKALAHYEKTKARTHGLVVTLEEAELASGFRELARARQTWQPKR